MANVAPLLPGDPAQLGEYRLVGRIGQGGQGTVYLARPASGEPVAVKVLAAEWTRDQLARTRFAREVAAAGKVAPFCTARILDAHLDGDQPFVVSEFIDGPSLQAVVATAGPLAGPALDRLAVATATALSAIHQAGVIHRDFKPGNVLLGPDGARVIDFGIARWADAAATLTSQVFGTPGYMAPEVVRGEPAGPPADVFAWAATITFAATGTPPFHAPNVAAIVHQITQGEPDLGTLAGRLRGVVADCLAKDPGARPTAVDLLMRLLRQSEPVGLAPRAAGVGSQVPGVGSQAAGVGSQVPGLGPHVPGRGPLAPVPGWAEPGQTMPVPGQTLPVAGQAAPPLGGYQMPVPGPAPRRAGGRAVAGWTAAIAGMVVLAVLGGLLVSRLMAGPSPARAPAAAGRSPVREPGAPGRRPAHGGRPSTPARAPTAPVATPANAIPAWFAGTWSGTGEQARGVVTRWTAILMLPEGATAGRFTIISIPCSATVLVTEVTRIRLVLSETVNSNPLGECAASGTISLYRTGLDRARMFWEESGDPANIATGAFARS
jgi:predicted Ser/Thr protein kinase